MFGVGGYCFYRDCLRIRGGREGSWVGRFWEVGYLCEGVLVVRVVRRGFFRGVVGGVRFF